MGYVCRTCGREHGGPPMAYTFEVPQPYDAVDPEQRNSRIDLGEEQCVIDGEHFFVRGNIEIPVVDATDPLVFTVWVSLSEQNFLRMADLWNTPGRESEPPYFGWLSNSISGYPDTFLLKTLVHTRPVGVRPRVELEPTDHPLAVDQRTGINMGRVRAIAELVEHDGGP